MCRGRAPCIIRSACAATAPGIDTATAYVARAQVTAPASGRNASKRKRNGHNAARPFAVAQRWSRGGAARVGEHGEHAAMIALRGGKAELGKDATDVLFDRRVADEESRKDTRPIKDLGNQVLDNYHPDMPRRGPRNAFLAPVRG